jgi:predicted lipoprotein with Yx(FWY)xxD motif
MVAITKAMCWKVVAKADDSSGIGLVIYQKPTSSSCYENRNENNPPLCENADGKNSSWYFISLIISCPVAYMTFPKYVIEKFIYTNCCC